MSEYTTYYHVNKQANCLVTSYIRTVMKTKGDNYLVTYYITYSHVNKWSLLFRDLLHYLLSCKQKEKIKT